MRRLCLQDDEEVLAPRPRAAPRRAAVASKKAYIDLEESDDSEAISLQDSEGSDFEA